MSYSLDKIAAELGISKTSVSMILNGKARQYGISEALENKVKNFCISKNYVINAHARRMQQAHSGSIGILIPSGTEVGVENPFTDYNITEILGGISKFAFEKGFQFSIRLYQSESSPEQIFNWVNSRDVDGIISYGYLSRAILKRIAKEKFPLVAIAEDPEIGVPTVTVDDYAGSRVVAEHLLTKGHKKILYIQGLKKSYVSLERFRGFSDAAKDAGVRATTGHFAGFSESQCYELVKSLISNEKLKYTAIQCANDIMAVGAIRALLEAGLRVPEDIAVAGGDDIGLARYVTPAITTFPRHLRELGELAFSLLYGILDKTADYQTHHMLPTSLITRQST